MRVLAFEDWPMSVQLSVLEAKPVAAGTPGAHAVKVCSICLGNGFILTHDGGTRFCLCVKYTV